MTCIAGLGRINVFRFNNGLTGVMDTIYLILFYLVLDPGVGYQVPGASVNPFWEVISTWIEEVVPAVLGGRA